MLSDSDYLLGYWLRDWEGLRLYITVMTVIFLIVALVGFLRARTQTARAAAVFLSVVAFCVARLVIPWMVLGRGVSILPGDVLISLLIPLSLAFGWRLFGRIYDSHAGETSLDQAQMVGLLS